MLGHQGEMRKRVRAATWRSRNWRSMCWFACSSAKAVPSLVRLMKEFFSRDDAADAVRALGPDLCRGRAARRTSMTATRNSAAR